MISRRASDARPSAWLHTDPPELAADGERTQSTLPRDCAGPPGPRPVAAQDGELRRLRAVRAGAGAADPRRLQHGRADRALHGAHGPRDRAPRTRRREPGDRGREGTTSAQTP